MFVYTHLTQEVLPMCKKNITHGILLFCIIFLCGCSYPAHKEYYSNIEDYPIIWHLTGFNHGYEGVSSFFPQDIKKLDVQEFYCRYDQQLPLGEGVQIFLIVKYNSNEEFDSECERISSCSFTCDNSFVESGLEAYATRIGENLSSEYALIDTKQNTVYYIYLQNIPKKEIEFDDMFLPVDYDGYGEIDN